MVVLIVCSIVLLIVNITKNTDSEKRKKAEEEAKKDKISMKLRNTQEIAEVSVKSFVVWASYRLDDTRFLHRGVLENRYEEVKEYIEKNKNKYMKYMKQNETQYGRVLLTSFFDSQVVAYLLTKSTDYKALLDKYKITANNGEFTYSQKQEENMLEWVLMKYDAKDIKKIQEILEMTKEKTKAKICIAEAVSMIVRILAVTPPQVASKRPLLTGGGGVTEVLEKIHSQVSEMVKDKQMQREIESCAAGEQKTKAEKAYKKRIGSRKKYMPANVEFAEYIAQDVMQITADYMLGMVVTASEYYRTLVDVYRIEKCMPYFGTEEEGAEKQFYNVLFQAFIDLYDGNRKRGYIKYVQSIKKALQHDMEVEGSSTRNILDELAKTARIMKQLVLVLEMSMGVVIAEMDYMLSKYCEDEIMLIIRDSYISAVHASITETKNYTANLLNILVQSINDYIRRTNEERHRQNNRSWMSNIWPNRNKETDTENDIKEIHVPTSGVLQKRDKKEIMQRVQETIEESLAVLKTIVNEANRNMYAKDNNNTPYSTENNKNNNSSTETSSTYAKEDSSSSTIKQKNKESTRNTKITV